jgi:formate dehydrogenase gamma subunit
MNRNVRCSIILALGIVSTTTTPSWSADPENCLSCHRYRGLGRIADDGKTIATYHVDPNYDDRALGPHARLRCTDCHERSEVTVVPHHSTRPVDCTQSCHLVEPGRPEMRFGHARIAEMLEGSVHTQEVLETCNRLLGHPVGPGQSFCLLCHDEPVFRKSDERRVDQETPVSRCAVCHDEQLPVNPRYMYWHVHARSRPARSHAELTRACAMCHSNEAVREAYGLPDTTASYLLSFHGKAMLLGSEETAGCLDCHVGQLQNVHLMQARTDPASNSACHAAAGEAVSAAAVHLELTPSARREPATTATSQPNADRASTEGTRVEFYVAIFFVVLILFTFGPSVVLLSLELLQVVVGRHGPEHVRHRQRAETLLADPAGRRALVRFTLHQRIQHWLLFATFSTLVITGFPIKFADQSWARDVVSFLGGLTVTRRLHRWAGVLMLAGFVYHLGYITWFMWKQRRATRRPWLRVLLDLPMVMRGRDWKQLWHLLGHLLFLRTTRLPGGRFSLQEKFEYFGVFWGCILLGITGSLLWANEWTSRYLSGRVLTIAFLIHTFEAFLALLHVGVVHVAAVIFAPGVFPVSRAMWTGDTPADKLADAHTGWLDEAEQAVAATKGDA